MTTIRLKASARGQVILPKSMSSESPVAIDQILNALLISLVPDGRSGLLDVLV